ncbi:hypothetical protein [Angustibacter luteus]|uniref:Uncharacterized protein n=1 Tax=Angustibacter luteus TaxID=658456 RepID=A0ABW1JKD9_9ACTN
MSPQPVSWGLLRRTVHTVVLLSAEQQWLRAVVLVTPPLAVLCAVAAGAPAPGAALVGAALLGLASAARPDSHWPAAALAAVGVYWLGWGPAGLSWWSLAAALLLLGCHAAAALASLGPPGMRVDAVTWRTWARRTSVVAAATVGVWALAWGLGRLADTGHLVLTVLGLLAVAVVTAGALTRPTSD